MTAMSSQITWASTVCLVVCSGADHRKHQSSVSLAFVRGIHRSPVNSSHKRPVTRIMLPLDDATMRNGNGVKTYNFAGCSTVCSNTYPKRIFKAMYHWPSILGIPALRASNVESVFNHLPRTVLFVGSNDIFLMIRVYFWWINIKCYC